MSEKNTLPEAIETSFKALMSEVHTCLPGTIETYKYETQQATVKPSIKKVLLNGEVKELPILINVPVVFSRSKKSGLTFPLTRGDAVLIHISERALERWKSSGGDVEPGDPRKFDLSDAICEPGCFSSKDKNLASNNEDLEIHHNGFKITIKKNGKIQIVNSTGLDLIAVIDEYWEQLKNTKVITGIGLQPFDPVSITLMVQIQTKLKQFLV